MVQRRGNTDDLASRPPVALRPMSERVVIRMTRSEKQALDAVARRNFQRIAEFCRLALPDVIAEDDETAEG